MISKYAIVIKDHTGTKIRKLIWLGEAVKVSELYQLATLQVVSFGQMIKRLSEFTHHIPQCQAL